MVVVENIQIKAYHSRLENELVSSIIKGKENAAKVYLDQWLTYVFDVHSGESDKINAMSIELLVIMSRAAVQGGAGREAVMEATQSMYSKIINRNVTVYIGDYLLRILERLMSLVCTISDDKKYQRRLIKKAVNYINDHAEEQISLQEVSDYVNLSPTYFSRLFSKEMTMTFIRYITKIRVEESKKYLEKSENSISDVAMRIGFNDQSYFSKVFKKIEGISPGTYRNRYLCCER